MISSLEVTFPAVASALPVSGAAVLAERKRAADEAIRVELHARARRAGLDPPPPGGPEPARAGPRRPVRRFNFISAVERRGPCRRAGRPGLRASSLVEYSDLGPLTVTDMALDGRTFQNQSFGKFTNVTVSNLSFKIVNKN